MAHSASIDTATLGAELTALISSMQSSVALGAFAGAVAVVLASTELSLIRKSLFFLISFISGILCAHFGADLLAGALGAWMPAGSRVDAGVGALLSSALSVKILLWFICRDGNPLSLLSQTKGDQK